MPHLHRSSPATAKRPLALSAFLAACVAVTGLATATAAPAQAAGVVPQTTTTTYTAPNPEPAYGTEAAALLETIPVKGRAPKTGYDRSQFGPAWLDADGNDCDTRNDMLNRDLTDITYVTSVPCTVASGTLADPHTATTIAFLRGVGTSDAVQIDHVVALSDAWQKGAQQFTHSQRVALANDPLNLHSPPTGPPTSRRATATPPPGCRRTPPSAARTWPARPR
ncbi:hypothetical protein GCM10012320_17670 [Sinomonas cellulolyticus]|uniref:HNH endonuclease family protein n=1 Tax=Sinomonas cellulolyticus TaxID=2801916 RepID=UPI00198F1B16|nr:MULTISPECIES: HNH endonuclease family protein [Sinomonas]GHG49517.1 hypothetical protein GCM10012320_17670 [Sinomonas sp. KCTC 49339]